MACRSVGEWERGDGQDSERFFNQTNGTEQEPHLICGFDASIRISIANSNTLQLWLMENVDSLSADRAHCCSGHDVDA